MIRDDEGSGDLLDTTLRDEIELVSDLVVAASASTRHFTPEEVDALLGVRDAHAAEVEETADGATASPTEDD